MPDDNFRAAHYYCYARNITFWERLSHSASAIIGLRVVAVSLYCSTVYDNGTTENQLRQKWLSYYSELNREAVL